MCASRPHDLHSGLSCRARREAYTDLPISGCSYMDACRRSTVGVISNFWSVTVHLILRVLLSRMYVYALHCIIICLQKNKLYNSIFVD